MEHRYSYSRAWKLALILTAVCAVCLLFSCRNNGRESGETAPPEDITDSVSPTEDIRTSELPAEESPDTVPPDITPETPEITAPDEPSVQPEVTPPPDMPETPEATESQEPTEPPETWNTPNKPKNGQMPEVPQTLPEIPPDREYPAPDKIAYITIDDGPTREITPQMLDMLSELGVRATFFVLPHSGVDDLYQRILDEGHVIGNHSSSHRYKPLYAEDTTYFTEDLLEMHAFLYDLLGYSAALYRFPGGAMGRNKATIAARVEILEEHGYTHFDWNSSTGDADATGEGKSTQTLISNVLDKTNGRAQLIVLMHDSQGKQTTADALPYIIDGLRMQGYAFDTLDNYG